MTGFEFGRLEIVPRDARIKRVQPRPGGDPYDVRYVVTCGWPGCSGQLGIASRSVERPDGSEPWVMSHRNGISRYRPIVRRLSRSRDRNQYENTLGDYDGTWKVWRDEGSIDKAGRERSKRGRRPIPAEVVGFASEFYGARDRITDAIDLPARVRCPRNHIHVNDVRIPDDTEKRSD